MKRRFRAAHKKSLIDELAVNIQTDASEALNRLAQQKMCIRDRTMYSAELDSAPGTVSQVRVCGNELMRIGKGSDLPVLIVAHVTKSGDLAGPKIVEHLVDTVLYFTGERSHDLRILRSLKNRFGTTNEIGAFEMREEGLTEVANQIGRAHV